MEPLFEELKKKAIGNKKKIILPESTEPRTLAAADRIIADARKLRRGNAYYLTVHIYKGAA